VEFKRRHFGLWDGCSVGWMCVGMGDVKMRRILVKRAAVLPRILCTEWSDLRVFVGCVGRVDSADAQAVCA
jgi:hypothetical protein